MAVKSPSQSFLGNQPAQQGSSVTGSQSVTGGFWPSHRVEILASIGGALIGGGLMALFVAAGMVIAPALAAIFTAVLPTLLISGVGAGGCFGALIGFSVQREPSQRSFFWHFKNSGIIPCLK